MIYWLMFALPVAGALVRLTDFKLIERLLWWATAIAFVLIVGLRNRIGWDWPNYEILLNDVRGLDLFGALGTTDPGYAFVEWVAVGLHQDLYFVDTVCAVLFLAGLFAFCRRQPDPWLALLAAVPYGVIVMGMGYTRQSAAVGLELFALLAFWDRKFITFCGFVLAAAMFHKAALSVAPLALLYGEGSPVLRVGLALAAGVLVFLCASLLDHYFNSYRTLYIDQALFSSDGAAPRLAINAMAAMGFLVARNYIPAESKEKLVMLAFAIASLAVIPVGFVYSTAADRTLLFLLPIQLFFWGRVGSMFSRMVNAAPVRLAGVAAYGAVQFVWLNYAIHASAWVPYHGVWMS